MSLPCSSRTFVETAFSPTTFAARCSTACASPFAGAHAGIAFDIHQHLVSPATARLSNRQPVLARDLIAAMDSARVRRALVLSIAYQFGNPNRPAVEHEYEEVRAENDWTAAQAAQY